MKKLIEDMLKAVRKYNIWDYGWLKMALCSFGILLGAYFSEFFLRYITVIWILFFVSYVWIIYKTLVKYKD